MKVQSQLLTMQKILRADSKLDNNAHKPSVRRQGFWSHWQFKLRESLAHLVGFIMRRVVGDASVAFRASFV